jgi:LysR family hydrogen peroxide-inducible transcriptional activator
LRLLPLCDPLGQRIETKSASSARSRSYSRAASASSSIFIVLTHRGPPRIHASARFAKGISDARTLKAAKLTRLEHPPAAAYDSLMPTLRQLEYLVAIADLGHFGRAAAACHVSQPTLSQQLRTLEERLGVSLVERGLGGAELTPIGREVAERARRLLVDARDLRDLARRAADGAAGTIRLGVTPTLGPYLLPPIVAALPPRAAGHQALHPGGAYRTISRWSSRAGQIDMLVGPLPIEGEGLNLEPLFREPRGWSRLRIIRSPVALRRARRSPGAPILSLDRRHHLHRQVAGLCAEYGMRLAARL